MNLNTGATLTGGATTVASPAGIQPGRSQFVLPTHSRLTPQTIDFTSSTPVIRDANKPGTARAGAKITIGNSEESEGCCTVVAGTVIFDIGLRWDLSQPESVVDTAIADLRALVYTTAFETLCKKGIVPTA